MVCKMVKKGVLGAALATGGLYLAFGTHAPSYVRTAFHKVRHTAKDSVPLPFEIDRAKEEVAALEPAILENREALARAEVDVEHLQKEIAAIDKNLDGEKTAMMTLREGIQTGDLRLAKNSSVRYTVDEAKADLAHRLDHYRNVTRILDEKKTTLKAREQAVIGARTKLTEMATQQRLLKTQIASIQARLEAIEATNDRNEFHFDDGVLARAKQTVAELEKRLEVKARVAEMEGRYPADALPTLGVESDRDVIREFDTEFGAAKDGASSDKKSL